ncbi:hypothetical protein [Lentimicrobium sp. S6]|uniref:hypothetical protein n=1 Tax=Lentimicrobium sp. S6 TaxID=2735872 RepID=UPI001551ED65|nr:hypothetical protein [Lentimicrobium sp. S6]NPD46745.1 hypothetical protein [Lentimicrobium sp. S6]
MKFQEIGSNFYRQQFSKSSSLDESFFIEKYGKGKSLIFPSMGRHALMIIIEALALIEKRILLPAYTCDTVVESFLAHDFIIDYYNCHTDLTLDVDDFTLKVNAFNPKIVLVHGYFGENTFLDAKTKIEGLREKGIIIIQDDTQTLFSENEILEADFYMASIRKWFAIPDGAFLWSKEIEIEEPAEENKVYIDLLEVAFKLKHDFTLCLDESIKKKYKGLYLEAQNLVDSDPSIFKMAEVSKGTFNQEDLKQYSEIRRENYNTLYHALSGKFKQVKPVFEHFAESNISPFCFPIYLEDKKEFQKRMSDNDVFATHFWPKADYIHGINEKTEFIYNNLLGIPCDQRYTTQDMERVIEVIKRYYS